VREADRFKADFSVGYGSAEGARGTIRLGVDNIAGQGVNLFAQSDLNTGPEIAERVRYTFMQRNINLGMRVKNIIVGLPGLDGELDRVDFRLDYFNTIDRSEDVYDLVSDSGVIGLDREFTSTIRGALQYTLEQNNYINLFGEPEGAIDTLIGVISPILITDFRNDMFNPTKGWYNAFQYDLAGRFVASNQNFMKLTNRISVYQEVTEGLVLAGSLGVGYGFTYGYSEDIPLTQRYFLGGMKSVRGYALKKLGPQYDDGSPRGGNLMLNYQLEVRFPIYSLLGGVIFSDGGNIWETPESFAGSGVRYAAGAGLRVATPIGPISLDYGVKLNPVEGDSPAEWHFTVGNAF
jgi:outer membrane protein insertion porin family